MEPGWRSSPRGALSPEKGEEGRCVCGTGQPEADEDPAESPHTSSQSGCPDLQTTFSALASLEGGKVRYLLKEEEPFITSLVSSLLYWSLMLPEGRRRRGHPVTLSYWRPRKVRATSTISPLCLLPSFCPFCNTAGQQG